MAGRATFTVSSSASFCVPYSTSSASSLSLSFSNRSALPVRVSPRTNRFPGICCSLSANDIKAGTNIEVDGAPWRVLGTVEEANVFKETKQFTYKEGSQFVFMDLSTYEETRLNESDMGEKTRWLKEGMECSLLYWKDKVIDFELPNTVKLKVVDVDPGLRGDTAQGGSKPATVETGAVVTVPLFVNVGEEILVDTRTELRKPSWHLRNSAASNVSLKSGNNKSFSSSSSDCQLPEFSRSAVVLVSFLLINSVGTESLTSLVNSREALPAILYRFTFDDVELDFSDVFGPLPEEASDVVFDEPAVVYSRSHSLVGPSSVGSHSFKLNKLTLRDTEDSVDLVESLIENDEFSGNDDTDSDKAPEGDLVKVSGVVGLEDFEVMKVVGKGAFGKVYQVRKKETSEIYAMKVMRKDKIMEKNHAEYMKAERDILTKIDHPFIVQLKYSFQTKYRLYLVLDFINGGHLFFQLYHQGLFREELARVYTAEIISAVSHLHEKGIMHRDLKPENILMDVDGHVMLTDFGLAKEFEGNTRSNSMCGTTEYMAPEIVRGKGHDKAADWWSVGILLYEMLTGKPPFMGSRGKIEQKIVKDKIKLPQFLSSEAHALLKGLLQKEPERRLGSGPSGAEEIKKHKWFNGMNWKKLEAREVMPSFKPEISGRQCIANFDKCWTEMSVLDSPASSPSSDPKANPFTNFTYSLEHFDGIRALVQHPLFPSNRETTRASPPTRLWFACSQFHCSLTPLVGDSHQSGEGFLSDSFGENMVSSECPVAANKNLTGKPLQKQLYLTITPPHAVLRDDVELEFSDVFGPLPEANHNSGEASDAVYDEPAVIYSRSHSLVGPSSIGGHSFKMNKLTLRDTEDSIDLIESLKESDELSGNDDTDSEKVPEGDTAEVLGVVGIEDFEVLKVVGQGAFGKVYQVRKKETSEIYAMKVMRKDRIMEKNHAEYMKAERDILTKIDHPFIVQLKYSFQTKYRLYLVLDFINGGHLFFQLYHQGLFREDLARVYTAEIVSAVSHLHEKGIMHRDLKPENILMDVDGHVMLTDFGLAKEFEENKRSNSMCGTVEYMAPEIVRGKGHDKAADWWSVGILLYEMLTGKPPFLGSKVKIQQKIVKDKIKLPQFLSTEAHALLKGLLQKEPERRLGSGPRGAEEIKDHKWFKGMNWKKLEAREVMPSFKPEVSGRQCIANFDKCWTEMSLVDSPVSSPSSDSKANPFTNFTYVRPPPSFLQQSTSTL
ncbi:unnamed protein product [Thlaspi arvense]|uniref:non-specific serine/threonine protein kinase n=1 Tax=Thlaspi arvense TaxID=13288 RepID=A0AAU9S5Z6_THLAR|nr:unnamed protein product [Thlaspi arvense]